MSLLREEEWLKMVEQLVEKYPILDTPFMRQKQMLWLEGKREGKLEGKLESKLEGKLEGELKVFSHLLEKRFGPLPGWVTEKLENATIEELEQWTLRILDVDSLSQIFE